MIEFSWMNKIKIVNIKLSAQIIIEAYERQKVIIVLVVQLLNALVLVENLIKIKENNRLK